MAQPKEDGRKIELCRVIRALACAGLATVSGCSFVPKTKLEDCHRVTQTVRAENNRLKDVALDLRSQNQDLGQRAVDDSRRIAAQGEAVARLERSVTAYQAEREALAKAYESLKQNVRVAVSPEAAAVVPRADGLEAFARAHPEWTFGPESGCLRANVDELFEAGGDVLKPEAAKALESLASAAGLSGLAGVGMGTLEVSGSPATAEVVKAGFDGGREGASERFLAAARAARIRERIVKGGSLETGRVRIAPGSGDEGATSNSPARIVIRLNRGLDTPPAPGKPTEGGEK